MVQPIELTPDNPYTLALSTPVLVHTPGLLRVMQRVAAIDGVGAILTAPIGGRRRMASVAYEVPAGVLLTGELWPAQEALRQASQWTALQVPALALLAEEDPGELAHLIQEFDEAAPLAGFVIEAGEAPPEHIAGLVLAARAATPLPLLLGLMAGSLAVEQSQAAAAAGIEGLLILYGPQGAVRRHGAIEHGLLDGPAADPQLLATTSALSRSLPDLPLVALAGSLKGAQAQLAAGARAVLVRAGLWRDPGLAPRIAQISRRSE